MTFNKLSEYLSELEETTLRNKIMEILAELFKRSDKKEIGRLCYLLQGRVAPLYEATEFGVADKMMIRAIAIGLEISEGDVVSVFKKTGDLGKTIEKFKIHTEKIGRNFFSAKFKITIQNSKITDVYDVLYKLATSTGPGSQERKIQLLADVLRTIDPLSAKYITRITLGKLRLGFSDMTVLDALSFMIKGDKSARKDIERAYNVRPDLGFIAETVKSSGISGLTHVKPAPGTPILMARANRLTSASEILEKIGTCAVEYKYDGLRLQVHYVRERRAESGERKTITQRSSLIKLFSRNLEDVTVMFPDIAEAVVKQIHADSVIFEGEVVAYNPQTGVFVPFQETMQRKRKYDIEKKAAEIPVKLFVFELLYCNGENFIHKPYKERKRALKDIINFVKTDTIIYAQENIARREEEIDKMFDDSVEKHFEGIIAKRIDGVYQAGMRGWNWIKYKKAMNKKLADTVDVLVMGYTLGEGKRTAFGVGQFLTGVYNKKKDVFVTVSKIGTGLTDEQFREFIKRVKSLKAKEKPPLYETDRLLTPDIWLEPGLVVEIGCDEITRSAVHTAGRVMMPSKSGKAFIVKTPGFALRFPRLIRFRDDRRPQDATTVDEIKKMYTKQGA